MTKKLLLFAFITTCVIASETKEWTPWVAAATKIYVINMQKKYTITISDTTQIKDIKNQLVWHVGLHPDKQSLYVAQKNWKTLWFARKGHGPLDNDKKIKDVMHKYNTNSFRLFFI